jgi:hypothetical protein
MIRRDREHREPAWRPARASRAIVACALAACALAACGDDGASWLAGAAEEARELELRARVPVVAMSREAFAEDAAERAADISDAYLRYYADTYGRLGYFDRDLDLRPVFAGADADWVGATYSPEEQRITLVGDVGEDVIVHEWVHALQDQHFDLIAYDVLDTTDAFLARRAVVEGDAVLAQGRFVRQQDGGDLDDVDWAVTLARWRDFSEAELATARYPLIFLDYVSFVYTYGLELAAHNLLGVSADPLGPVRAPPPPYDWSRADALFTARPPATTQAVLALDLTGDAIAPETMLGLGALPPAVADRLEHLDWDALGAWYVYLLFYPLAADGLIASARDLAAGWNGDRADFVRRREDGEIAVVWTTAWTSGATATAVAGALWTLHGGVPAPDGPAFAGAAADGEPLWIEQRAQRVVSIKNLAPADAAVLAEAAFAAAAPPGARRFPSLAATFERWRGGRGSAMRCPDVLPMERGSVLGGFDIRSRQ